MWFAPQTSVGKDVLNMAHMGRELRIHRTGWSVIAPTKKLSVV